MDLTQLDFDEHDYGTPIPCEEHTDAMPVVWPIWWLSTYDGRTVRYEAPGALGVS